MAPHSRRDPCLLLLYCSVVAPSVFAGLWVLPGINPQAVHGHREFQALQCALTRHETACESKVKTRRFHPIVAVLQPFREKLWRFTMDADRDDAGGGTGSALRRRERRLRSFLRHERIAVAMALSEFKHHSSRGQRKDRAGGEVRVEPHGGVPGAPLSQGGSRPPCLGVPRGPQVGLERHFLSTWRTSALRADS